MGIRRLKTLSQLQVNLFGFSILDVNARFQATFNLVGKGQQRKRHDESRHRQPESAASGAPASLRARHFHQRSSWVPASFRSSVATPMIGHTHDNESQ